MLKIIILLSFVMISVYSKLEDLVINKYPYSLMSKHLDLSLSNCVFFNYYSYSVFHINSTNEKSNITYDLTCSYSYSDKIISLTLSKADVNPSISETVSFTLNTTEVVRNFTIYGKETKSDCTIELTFSETSNLTILIYDKTDKDKITSNNTYPLAANQSAFSFDHFMLRNSIIQNSALFGYVWILSGLFIAILSFLYQSITTFLLAIFVFVQVITEISEPLFPSDMLTQSLGFIIIIATILLGTFIGWVIKLQKDVQHCFYGVMLGMVLFNIISFCYLLIPYNGFSYERLFIDFLWLIIDGLFGFLWFLLRYKVLCQIITTAIVGSYYIVTGFNLLLGGYLDNVIAFSIRKMSRELGDDNIWKEYKKKWANEYVLMYFILWVIFSIAFFMIQCYLRSRHENEKPPSEQLGLLMLDYSKKKCIQEDVKKKKKKKKRQQIERDLNDNSNFNRTNNENENEDGNNNNEEANMSVNRYSYNQQVEAVTEEFFKA